MTDLGHFASSSSSSNLSPLAPPFTVERSNRSKPNSILDLDSNFYGKSDGVTYSSILPNFHSPIATQGLSADSIRNGTQNWSGNKSGLEPVNQAAGQFFDANSTYTNAINSPSTHNWSSNKLGLEPTNQAAGQLFGSNSTYTNPINSPSIHNWSSLPNPTSSPSTHNWASHPNPTNLPNTQNWSSHPNPINSPSTHNRSSIKSGLEVPINQPAGNLFGANFKYPNPINSPNTHNWSSMNSSIKSGLEPLNQPVGQLFDVNPNLQPAMWNLSNDDREDDDPLMSLNFDALPNNSLFSDYGSSSSQVGYSQSLFGSKYSAQADPSRGKEDSMLRPSIIGKSHDANNGHFSSGFSKENTITSKDNTSNYPFETRSIMFDSFRDKILPSITISPPSVVIKPSTQTAINQKPLKGKDFEAEKNCLTSNVPDINTSKDVKSGAEQLDNHNSAEDSPCWKGAPNQLLSSSSAGSGSWYSEPDLSDKKVGQSHHYLHVSVNNPSDLARADSLDVTNTLRILINFSEFLSLHCSMGETALKEPEYMALDHVIATLNGCLSKKNQQSDAAENDQKRKNDNFGKNIEELQSVDLPTKKSDDLHLPKDYNMIQKIKKVLDENLECKEDLPFDTLLYKNLWLETEAELCAVNYKARFNRVKRDMERSESPGNRSTQDGLTIASEIKNSSSSTYSPMGVHEDADNKTLNSQLQNSGLPSVDDQNDDVENSVMARFNILKLLAESNPVNMADKESADCVDKTQSCGVGKAPKMLTEDVDHLVMARFNILKSRGTESQSCVGPHFQHQPEDEMGSGSGSGVDTNSIYGASSDWEYVSHG